MDQVVETPLAVDTNQFRSLATDLVLFMEKYLFPHLRSLLLLSAAKHRDNASPCSLLHRTTTNPSAILLLPLSRFRRITSAYSASDEVQTCSQLDSEPSLFVEWYKQYKMRETVVSPARRWHNFMHCFAGMATPTSRKRQNCGKVDMNIWRLRTPGVDTHFQELILQ